MNATSPADGSKSSRPAGRKVCPRDPPCWAASPTSVLPCGRLPGSPELEGGGRAPSALSLADGAMKPFRKIAPEYFRRCSTARLASPAALVLPAAEGQSAAPGPPRRPAPGGGTRFGAWNHPDFRGALRCARRAPPPAAARAPGDPRLVPPCPPSPPPIPSAPPSPYSWGWCLEGIKKALALALSRAMFFYRELLELAPGGAPAPLPSITSFIASGPTAGTSRPPTPLPPLMTRPLHAGCPAWKRHAAPTRRRSVT